MQRTALRAAADAERYAHKEVSALEFPNFLQKQSFTLRNLPFSIAMSTTDVQYISDEQGDLTGVIVPIALWQEIISELETHHLLQSETMKKRLLEARGRQGGLSFEAVLEQLGLE